jgi:L-ascorbate oxidase
MPKHRRVLLSVALSSAAAFLCATSMATAQERVLVNPPIAKKDAAGVYRMKVNFKSGEIYNPQNKQNDKVNLRNYLMPTVEPTGNAIIGATIYTKPGDKVQVGFENILPDRTPCKPVDHNVPNCPNITNLHTHGLWVTPKGNGDNVLIEFNPGDPEFNYAFDIPSEHPAGTFWYHAHRHGSTALQLASGMSGALIIQGNRAPTRTQNGDIDTLLAPFQPVERIMLFQQISYGCGANQNNPPDWNCKDKLGTIDNYQQIGFGAWAASGRYSSINGVVLPTIKATAGRIERWRMIHGGIGETLNVFIREAVKAAPSPEGLSAAQESDWTTTNCTGTVVHQFVIASDGLTRSMIVDRAEGKPSTLQPGYRDDALVIFPHAGRYCVMDSASGMAGSISQSDESARLLAEVDVANGTDVPDPKAYLLQVLSAAASHTYSPEIAFKVRNDLNATDGMRLWSFVPHPSLMGVRDPGRQELAFDNKKGFTIATKLDNSNAKVYDGSIERTLKLGTTDEWVLTSFGGGHPYHIHVNPFQIKEILNPAGVDVSATGEPSTNPEDNDMEYADLKNQWKDTIFVKNGYKVVFRTHYARFDGQFVLHCHILDHEDKGMMEKIEIVQGGVHRHAHKKAPMKM